MCLMSHDYRVERPIPTLPASPRPATIILTVFEPVVFAAWLAEVADTGGAAVCPGEEVVCFVVEGVVIAAGERALPVAQAQPLAHGFGDAVAGQADLQRGAVTGVGQDPVEGIGAVGDEPAGHGRRDGSVAVQHCRFGPSIGVGFGVRAQEGKYGDGDEDVGCRARGSIRDAAEQPVSGGVGAELDEGPGFGGALQGACCCCGAVPDAGCLVAGRLGGEPGHAVPV
jgi:hypothetical protein